MYYTGVDLGGTKISAGIFDLEGRIIERTMVLTPKGGWEKVGDEIVNCIKKITKSANLELEDIKRIGIGCPGTIDIRREIIHIAPNLHWKNVPFRRYLNEQLNIPVRLENDVNLGTLGVSYFGEGKGISSLIGIFVGTGIGAGIVINGELYIGYTGTAAEFGHMVVDINGYQCGCGNRGCWETIASRISINRIIDEYIKKEGEDNDVGRLFKRIENRERH